MQSEHVMFSADVGLLAIKASTAGASRTSGVAVMRDDNRQANDRWPARRARIANADCETASMVNRVFVASMLTVSAWMVVQLLR